MAHAGAAAAVVLAFAVCCLLVAPAPARRPLALPPRALHAAEPLLHPPKPVVDCAEADEQGTGTALAVPEEEPRRQRSSLLLCLVFRCGREPAGPATLELDEWVPPAVPWTEEAEDEKAGDVVARPYEMGSDSDCDSDSDDDGDDGFLGWLWSLVDRF